MNKIYMVKRNTLGQSVVASELAKSKGKLSSVAKVVGLAILGLSSSAFAETTNEITTYGQGATAQTGGTAVGVIAKADTNGTAIGQQATASTQATANGYVAAALANETIAIGVNSGAVGGGLGKETVTNLQEIDNKITEYSKETPIVDPLNAIKPTLLQVGVSNLGLPLAMESGIVFNLLRDDELAVYSGSTSEYLNQISDLNNKTQEIYSSFLSELKSFTSLMSNLTEEEQRNLTLESTTEKYNAVLALKNNKYNELASLEQVDQTRLTEITSTNSELVIAVEKLYDSLANGADENFSSEEKALISNNSTIVEELIGIYYRAPYYSNLKASLEKSMVYSLGSLNGIWNPSSNQESLDAFNNAAQSFYNKTKANLQAYDTALAEYNAKVAVYEEAVKNREITEAERVVKLEEAIKELNDKATELGLGDGYTNLSQVLGSLEGRAIAIGNKAFVSGDEAIGVGYGNTVTGSRSNVIGTHNNVTKANNNVMGNDNNITVSEGNVIVGNAITFAQGVTTSDNIALGSNTVISAPVPTASVEIQGVTHNFAGTNPTSVLSIANEGNERQIQNVAAGRVTNTSTDAINGSQLYAVVEALNAIQTINIDDISDAISTEINITGGDNVQVSREGNNFTISATGTTLTAGDNITVEGDATNGYTIKATNTQSVVKAGNGVTVDVADNDIGTKDYTVSTKIGDGLTFGSNGEIKATGTIINAGDNITVTGDALNGYTISTKGGITDEQLQDVINQINGIVDTNTQSTTSAGQGIVVTETDNTNGTKNYAVSIKATDGLTFDDNGNIKVSDTLVKAGDNVQVSGNAKDGFTVSAKGTEITAGDNVNVSGDAKNGYTISVENMRTTVTGGQGAEVTSSDNTDGSKNYTVNVKVGEGLTYDDKGNLVNDMKLTAGENVQVSGDAKGGYTISATDTNTQATVSAEKGITITETNNANGTKNYAVSAKLGKGLKVDENGAIAATAQPINGGAGVSITTNAQDEAVVNVAGVTTTTDDGKSYTRSDLTKPVGVKGDGKNVRTSTAANGDVQVKLADDVKVNSVTTGNVSISTKGVNAGGKKVTNVAPAEISPTSTDAVNGSQLHATNIQVHNNTQNIAKLGDRVNHLDTKVNKVNKEARAGIAGTVATASLPQVYMAGKSMVSAAAGHYKNENAVAVGYSRASDNGKLVFKLNSSANTRGDFTVGTGIGYQW